MLLDTDGMEPIYVRLARWLEDEILGGALRGEERIYSQYQLAELFNINPATAAKGLTLLLNEGVVYKQRGMGMYVAHNAKQIILEKRRGGEFRQRVKSLAEEAKRLDVSAQELAKMIGEAMTKEDKGDGE